MVFMKICPVDINFAIFSQQYEQFKDEVRQELLGKTAQFWMSYIDDVAVLRRVLRATKRNDLNLLISSLLEMCPLFFAYD